MNEDGAITLEDGSTLEPVEDAPADTRDDSNASDGAQSAVDYTEALQDLLTELRGIRSDNGQISDTSEGSSVVLIDDSQYSQIIGRCEDVRDNLQMGNFLLVPLCMAVGACLGVLLFGVFSGSWRR